MGLDEDAVDQIDIDCFFMGSDGFEHTAQTEVACPAQDAVGGPDDESERVPGKGVVTQTRLIKLIEDESRHIVRIESFHDDRIGDAGFDIVIDF